MLLSKKRRITVGLIVLALVVAASAAVLSKSDPVVAQAPPGMGEAAPQGPPPPGAFGGKPAMPMMGMGMGMMGGMPAIAATNSHVYVVQGNTLYQFSAKTLKQVNKTRVAATAPMPPRYPMEGPGPGPGQPAPPMAPGM